MLRALAVLFVYAMFCFAYPAHAQVFDVPPGLNDAYKRGKEIFDLAKELNEMVEDAQNGKKPKPHNDKFKDIVKAIDDIADHIRKANFSIKVDAKAFSVSFEEFKRCETREAANKKLDEFLNVLKGADSEGEALDTQIKDALAANRASIDIIQVLQKQTQAITGNPFLTELNWLWWDLDKVSRAFSGVGNALSERQKQLTKERQTVATMKSNFSGNLDDLKKVDCSIAGTWSGTANFKPEAFELVVAIEDQPKPGKCTIKYPAAAATDCCEFALDIKTRIVSWKEECGANGIKYSAVLAEDFKSMRGNITDPAFPAPPTPFAFTKK